MVPHCILIVVNPFKFKSCFSSIYLRILKSWETQCISMPWMQNSILLSAAVTLVSIFRLVSSLPWITRRAQSFVDYMTHIKSLRCKSGCAWSGLYGFLRVCNSSQSSQIRAGMGWISTSWSGLLVGWFQGLLGWVGWFHGLTEDGASIIVCCGQMSFGSKGSRCSSDSLLHLACGVSICICEARLICEQHWSRLKLNYMWRRLQNGSADHWRGWFRCKGARLGYGINSILMHMFSIAEELDLGIVYNNIVTNIPTFTNLSVAKIHMF